MRIITKSQYYILIGLREVARKNWEQLCLLEKAAAEITGESEKDGLGHSSDYLAGSRELDDMLRILEIKVENE